MRLEKTGAIEGRSTVRGGIMKVSRRDVNDVLSVVLIFYMEKGAFRMCIEGG